jgi:hypothetical protein
VDRDGRDEGKTMLERARLARIEPELAELRRHLSP